VLPRKNRLREERDIKRIFLKGERFNSPFFTLISLTNINKESRATVIVSKKYDKRAVYRNKLKRKFRETIHHSILSLRPSSDIIILPKANSKDTSFYKLQESFKEIFKKLNNN